MKGGLQLYDGVKTELRIQLNGSTIHDIIMIYLEDREIVNFHPTPAIQKWFQQE